MGAAIASAPVVMTDRAMTAAMGDRYAANTEPTAKTLEDQAIDDFQAGFVDAEPGLGILPGAELEPRLAADYRWGRLYALSMAQPADIVFGICQGTALVLNGGSASVSGALSVVSVDGRTATFGAGDNGALAAFDVLLNTYAPGDALP